jgi:hypothetical protein
MTNLYAELIHLYDRLVTIGHERKVTYQEAAHDPEVLAPHRDEYCRPRQRSNGKLGIHVSAALAIQPKTT